MSLSHERFPTFSMRQLKARARTRLGESVVTGYSIKPPNAARKPRHFINARPAHAISSDRKHFFDALSPAGLNRRLAFAASAAPDRS